MFILLIAPFPVRAQSEAKLSAGFASKDANVEGLKIALHPFAPRGRPKGIYRCVFPPRANESGLAIFCIVATDRQRLRGIVADQADHARAVDRRREVAGKELG